MKFVFVETLPEKKPGRERSSRHDLFVALDTFCASCKKVARVEFSPEEYLSAKDCYASLTLAVKRYRRPIHVYLRNGNVYLVREDIK